jgi:hypothetical protein
MRIEPSAYSFSFLSIRPGATAASPKIATCTKDAASPSPDRTMTLIQGLPATDGKFRHKPPGRRFNPLVLSFK